MTNLCWIRRDLRLHDHHALSRALASGPTYLTFVFDSQILGKLTDPLDFRVNFIFQSLRDMETKLKKIGASLIVRYGNPVEEIPKLAAELKVSKVFINRDYEPYAVERDRRVADELARSGVEFESFKDSVHFEAPEVLTLSGAHYKVFTAYKNRWLEKLSRVDQQIPCYNTSLKQLVKFKNPQNVLEYDWLETIGFYPNPPIYSGGTTPGLARLHDFEDQMADYAAKRNFPSLDATSGLAPYLRHGNLSVRDLIRSALAQKHEGSRVWLSELIWRDFYQMILATHPEVATRAFRPEFERIRWRGGEQEFAAWCEGTTGVPIVDASMRCLNATGLMHNRLRMVVASYLCKILLVDWKKGEVYFAQKLLDFDLAANNGGWQWSAGTGTDAQPYFRIFNPYNQSKKFDPEGAFIRRWCPELEGLGPSEIHRPPPMETYPEPVVEYESGRAACLQMYSVVKS